MMSLPLPQSNKGIAFISLAVSLLVLCIKYAAYLFSDSIALYADAIETIINVIAAISGLWALSIVEQPADHNHTYGHYKAEYLSAVAEGTLVTITAFVIGHDALKDWFNPHPLLAPWKGLALSGIATILNFFWGIIMVHTGRQRRSPALIAGGKHVLSDVWTGAALVIGVGLVCITGWERLDAILAGFVALNVLHAGWEVMRDSIAGLMDQAPDAETFQQIRTIITENGQGAIEVHDIRTRIVGAMTFLDFHMVVPGSMSVTQAHDICDRIEEALHARMGDTLVHIHVEPDFLAKHEGIIFNTTK
ncbi:MAG: cation transporter [Acetobacter sp.]|nr:cation transporter [Acetobacter sp.]